MLLLAMMTMAGQSISRIGGSEGMGELSNLIDKVSGGVGGSGKKR